MAKAAKPKTLPDVAGLTKAQAKVEHKRLALELEGHDRRYYQDDAPSVTDAEYDALRQRFNAIEARFPDLVTSESPSQKVGAAPSGRFKKVRHAVAMLSLDNAFAEEDVLDFVGRIRRFLKLGDDDRIDFSAEPKIDGLSMSLRYEGGELITAATRGDGVAAPSPRLRGEGWGEGLSPGAFCDRLNAVGPPYLAPLPAGGASL